MILRKATALPSYKRIKERCGLPKKAVERSATLALQKGLSHKESTGSLKRYFDYLFLSHKKGSNIRLYGNHVYIFTQNSLVTVLPLPNEHKKSLLKAFEKRERLITKDTL